MILTTFPEDLILFKIPVSIRTKIARYKIVQPNIHIKLMLSPFNWSHVKKLWILIQSKNGLGSFPQTAIFGSSTYLVSQHRTYSKASSFRSPLAISVQALVNVALSILFRQTLFSVWICDNPMKEYDKSKTGNMLKIYRTISPPNLNPGPEEESGSWPMPLRT